MSGLFVSSVEGRPVTRFGTSVLIGAHRDPTEPRKVVYRTAEVIEIPRAEADRYAREYARLIAEGDLVAHSADEREERVEVGAPREQPTSVEPDELPAKDPPNADLESGRE